jgi:tRNA (guanine-N7-)-methyltransferase
MDTPRDIRGTLNGSRLFEQPQYRDEAARFVEFLQAPGPRLLEVGFDHGRRILDTADRNPDWRIAGLEVREKRVHGVMVRGKERGLDNLLAWRADARTVLANVVPPSSFDIVEVLFPTPWWNPKLRAKRLLLTPEFIEDVHRCLRPGGLLLVATDVERYALEIAESLEASPLSRCDDGWQRRPACEALSRRERKCEREGLDVWRFAAERHADG